MAFVIVGVTLLSQPQQQKLPALKINISTAGNVIKVYHDGGDPVPVDEIVILANGAPVAFSGAGSDELWQIGETLIAQAPAAVLGVQVVLQPGSGQYNLASYGETTSFGPPIVTTTMATPTPTPTPTSTPAPVTADFTGTPASGTRPLSVQFTDGSTGPITLWAWNFGDGNTSTVQNPLFTYRIAGTYTVGLTVSNGIVNSTLIRPSYITITTGPPTITTITPNYGLRGRIVSITNLTGTNFITGTTPEVRLYKAGQTNITGTGVTVVSPTQITNTFTIPSDALMGLWGVVVINADGQPASGGTNLFEIRRPLVITSVSPATTQKNKAVTVTINGEGFLSSGTTGVVFTQNGTSTTVTGTNVTYIAETQITAYFDSPVNIKDIYYDVTVTNPAPDSQVAFYPKAILTT